METEKTDMDKTDAEKTEPEKLEMEKTGIKETDGASINGTPSDGLIKLKKFGVYCLTYTHKFADNFQYNSPVILTYAIASFVVLLIAMLTKDKSTALLFSVYSASPTDPLMYIRLFGYVLGHVSFAHLFNNFLLILLIGPALEEKYGSKKLLVMILLTAVSTGILHMLISGGKLALLGASGVLFMMIVLSSFVNLKSGKIPMTFVLIVLVFLGKELVDVVYASDNISRFTHIFGGVCGVIFGFVLNRSKLFGKKKKEAAE